MSNGSRLGWPSQLGIVTLAGGSIAALLADMYGIAAMTTVFWLVSLPSMVLLTILAITPRVDTEVRERIRVGAVAGVVGTIGYDIVRVPFALAGQRVFAPIESYGVLIADAQASSGVTSTLGWLYHLSNGGTFAIAYAAVMARQRWPWGIVWALTLETAAVLSPFGARYGLSGQAVPIVIAYGAHVFYGYPVGRVVQDLDDASATLHRLGRHSVAVILVGSITLVIGWHRPWSHSPEELAAARLSTADVPAAIVVRDRFEPEWLRVRTGGCVLVDNRSDTPFETLYGNVAPATTSSLCFSQDGAVRVRLGPKPYSGGFVYVDAKA
jgi:hypothetical protein